MGDDTDEVLAKMQAAIKKEEAKVKRCERLGLRHKNNLFTMIEKYKEEARRNGAWVALNPEYHTA